MNLTIFILFMSISLILTIIGFWLNVSVFNIAGTTIIFFLGLSLLSTPLTYATGETTTYIYTDNLTDYSINNSLNSSDVVVAQQVSVPIYSSYDDASSTRFGSVIMFAGILGFCLSMFFLGRD